MERLCDGCRALRTVLSALRIEPFVFLFVFSVSLSAIPVTQLIQDKICLNEYNKSIEFCIGLSETKAIHSDDERIKSLIIADVSQLTIYYTVIGTLPSFVIVLFVGSWTDNYIHGRKIALLMGMLGYVLGFALLLINAIDFDFDVYYVLLAYIPVGLMGGWSCIWLTSYSYMSNNSSPKYRFIKFAAFDVAVSIAMPLGTFLGGQLLGSGDLRPTDKQIHNYKQVFTVSLIAAIVAFVWIVFAINENDTKIDENSNLFNRIEEQNTKPVDCETQPLIPLMKRTRIGRQFKLSDMFDMNNIRDVLKTATKVRPNNGRAQIWLLYLSMAAIFFCDVKNFAILFPYVEQVFGWDAKHFTQIDSLASIYQIITNALIVTVLSAVLKLSDITLGIVGFLSYFVSVLCVGTVTQPMGLYLMYGAGVGSRVASTAIRSVLSKIATERESGKVFSLLAALETVAPPLNVLFYNTLFRYTLDYYPSVAFQTASAFAVLPLIIFIWFDFIRIQCNQ